MRYTEQSLFPLLFVHCFQVKVQLLSLENVAVGAAALPWAGRYRDKEAATVELVGDVEIDDAALLPSLELTLDMVRFLAISAFLLFGFLGLLFSQLDAVVLLVPLAERRRIDLYDGILHQRLRTHKFVVRRVVDDVENARFAGAHFGAPRKIASVQSQSALQITCKKELRQLDKRLMVTTHIVR